MTRSGISGALAVFVALTVVLGASTAYLVAAPMVQSHTTTSTVLSISTSTATQTATLITVSTSTETEMPTTGSTGAPAFSVGIAYKAGIGFYLVDASGMTLYFRTADIHSNGTSTCTGQCVNIWPAFDAPITTVAPGLNTSSFIQVQRADGMFQIDYNNWPLYHFSGDSAPGDTNGQGIGGIWFAYTLPVPSQLTSTTSIGTTITTSSTSATSATSTTTMTSSTSTTDSTTTTTSTTSTSTTTHTSSSSTCTIYCY